jgi:hypothetical protein
MLCPIPCLVLYTDHVKSFKAQCLLFVPPGFTFKNSCTFLVQCIYWFLVSLKINGVVFPKNINRLVFVMEGWGGGCVLCDVGNQDIDTS